MCYTLETLAAKPKDEDKIYMQAEQYEQIWDTESCSIASLHAIESEPHFHSAVEILIGREGKLRALINHNEYFVKKGDILVTNPYEVHAYFFCGETPVVNVIIFPFEYLSGFFNAHKNMKFAERLLQNPETYANAVVLLNMFDIARVTNKPSLAKSLGMALFEMIAKDIPFTEKKDEQATLIKDILSYLYEHFQEEITLTELAKKYGYSPNYFSGLFHAYLNMNLNGFVNGLRVNYAVDAMQKGRDVISAAFDSGFNSLRTFYRAFGRKLGMTPKEYMKTKLKKKTDAGTS